jgi:hypothetical protein
MSSTSMSTCSTSMNLTVKGRPTLTELMTRSTIYHRHEARRAKTLLRKDDPRPALLRVFGGAPVLAPVLEAAATVAQVPEVMGTEFRVEQSFSADFEDHTVFTFQDTTSSTDAPHNHAPVPITPGKSVLAAAIGAVLVETIYGARSLQQASPFAPSRVAAATVSQPQLVLNPESASLMLVQRPLHTISSTVRNVLSPSISVAQMASRAAPVALLFGTKSSVDQVLTSGSRTASPPAALAILSSATAGGVLGCLRSLVPGRLASSSSTVVGREVMGATLYFGAYDGLKHLLVQPQHRAQWNPLVTAVAGSLAGVCYESVRLCNQQAALQQWAVPQARSLATVATRAAPSHALLFLGYEGALRLSQPY